MKKYDNLAKIAELRDRGALSEEAFQQEKYLPVNCREVPGL